MSGLSQCLSPVLEILLRELSRQLLARALRQLPAPSSRQKKPIQDFCAQKSDFFRETSAISKLECLESVQAYKCTPQKMFCRFEKAPHPRLGALDCSHQVETQVSHF